MKKSEGHITFLRGYEYYLSASGDLYRAHVSNVIASDTQRRHGRFEAPAHMVDKHPLICLSCQRPTGSRNPGKTKKGGRTCNTSE